MLLTLFSPTCSSKTPYKPMLKAHGRPAKTQLYQTPAHARTNVHCDQRWREVHEDQWYWSYQHRPLMAPIFAYKSLPNTHTRATKKEKEKGRRQQVQETLAAKKEKEREKNIKITKKGDKKRSTKREKTRVEKH